MRFSVLGSGSRGNSCLVRAGGPGLLIDIGMGPRAMTERLSQLGVGWDAVGAVVLTHTHSDHVDGGTLNHLAKLRIPLYCHEGHRSALVERQSLDKLDVRRLVRIYDGRPWIGPGGLRVESILAHHDDPATFGFRIEGRSCRRGPVRSLGYLADTGIWTAAQADALADVDLLGVEFNHDVEMQRTSGRPPFLVRRVLGNRGHLSNTQGAELVRAVVSRSRPGRVRSLVLLHLSEQCNCPRLARETAREALKGSGRRVNIVVAEARRASPDLEAAPVTRQTARSDRRPAQPPRSTACKEIGDWPMWF